jgi:hypothetical protein
MPAETGYVPVPEESTNDDNVEYRAYSPKTQALADKISSRKVGIQSPGSPLDASNNTSSRNPSPYGDFSVRGPAAKDSLRARKAKECGNKIEGSYGDESGGESDSGDKDGGLGRILRAPPGTDLLVPKGHAAQYSFSDRFYYKLENLISGNPNIRYEILIVSSLFFCLVLASAWIRVSAGDSAHAEAQDYSSATFMALQMLFTGGADTSIIVFNERVVYGTAMVTGIVLTSVLIGLITDSVNDYMSSLKNGKSPVIESGHTLILGWSDKLIPIIRQLSLANASKRGGCVVVLSEAPRTVEELKDEILDGMAAFAGGLLGTRVVVRVGSPLVMEHLNKVWLP